MLRNAPGLGQNKSLTHFGRHFRSEEHTSELQSQSNIVCRLLLEKKKTTACAAVLFAHNAVPVSRATSILLICLERETSIPVARYLSPRQLRSLMTVAILYTGSAL